MVVLRFRVLDSFLRAVSSHGKHRNANKTQKRKSKICSAKVVRFQRPTRKSHRNTENIKNRLDGTHVVPSPSPTRNPRKSTEFTKRGTGAEKWMLFSFIWGAGGGEAFKYTRGRFAFPFLRRCCGRGAKPSSTPAVVLRPPSPPLARAWGEAFEYARGRFAFPFFFGCAAGGGVFLLLHKARPGEKPSSTPAVD